MNINECIDVDSYSEYLHHNYQLYQDQNRIFYRGQLTRYGFEPTIARGAGDFCDKEVSEYSNSCQGNESVLERLAKMQHYGKPTRLLDMTIDTLVALYFAVTNTERADASVYLFIRPNIDADSLHARILSFIATQANRQIDSLVDSFNLQYNETVTKQDFAKYAQTGAFITPNTIKTNNNERMKRQKGTFAIPGNIIENGKITGIKPLTKEKGYEEIIIPFEHHEYIRKKLDDLAYDEFFLLGQSERKQFKYRDNSIEFYQRDEKIAKKGVDIGKQLLVTLEVDKLISRKEILQKSFEVVKQSNVKSAYVWFRRSKSQNMLVRQEWRKGNGLDDTLKVIFPDGWSVDPQWFHDYVVGLINDTCDRKYKLLPVDPNAKEVILNAKLQKDHMVVLETNLPNLLDDTLLNISYYDDKDNNEKSVDGECKVRGGIVEINAEYIDKNATKIMIEVSLIVSNLQPSHVIQKVGHDYELLKGDFIKRPENSSIVYGRTTLTVGLG